MKTSEINDRLTALARTSRASSPEERLPFEIEDRVVGSVTPADARLLAREVPGVELTDDSLSVLPVCAPDAPAVLEAMALVLKQAGRIIRWRDELLPVCADDGTVMGKLERGCVRTLGVRTFAVHLVGLIAEKDTSDFWLQRRAADKDVDPNMLDTLAGGLVGMSADGREMEAFGPALTREVQEEAGLNPDQYSLPISAGTWRVNAPVDGGYMVEDLMVWHATLAKNQTPVNQDGEVSEFMRVSQDELIDLIDRQKLTREAAIVSLLAMQNLDR
ncbi:MAG: NUDIX domain-containing protein [Burkholderiaceae bacterium]